MAMKKCKECGNQVSTKAKSCPNCGAKVKKTSIIMKIFLFFIVFTFLMPFIASLSDNETPSSNNAGSSKTADKVKDEILDIRTPKTEGIAVKVGPGEKYRDDPTGALMGSEKLYVLEERSGWIRFRVTKDDQGWSGWVPKYETKSIEQVKDKRIAKFGKPPITGWDGAVTCVEMYLERVVREPDSLEYIDWSDVYFNENDGWLVKCTYRAKNGFGGYEVGSNWFVIQHGQVVDIKEADAYGY